MKLNLVLFCIFLFFCGNIFAQYTLDEYLNSSKQRNKLQYGVIFGPGASSIHVGNSKGGDMDPFVDFKIGGFANYSLAKAIAVRPELIINTYKSKEYGLEIDNPYYYGPPMDYDLTFSTTYLQLPVTVLFSPNNLSTKLMPHIGAGLHLGFPIAASTKGESSDLSSLNKKSSIISDINNPAIGYQASFGISFDKFFAELTYEHELSRLYKKDYVLGDLYFWSGKLVLGYVIK